MSPEGQSTAQQSPIGTSIRIFLANGVADGPTAQARPWWKPLAARVGQRTLSRLRTT